MRRNAQKILGLFLFTVVLIFASACTSDPVDLPAGVEADGKTLKISLEENPTTGFSWDYTVSDETLLEVVDDEYFPSNTETAVVGSGGIHVFEFQGLKEGETTLTFNYFKSWEGTEKTEDTRVYKIIVDQYGNIEDVQ